jgi:hypothetical protein
MACLLVLFGASPLPSHRQTRHAPTMSVRCIWLNGPGWTRLPSLARALAAIVTTGSVADAYAQLTRGAKSWGAAPGTIVELRLGPVEGFDLILSR